MCFKEFANYVLQENNKEEVEETKESIVKAAAKIIKLNLQNIMTFEYISILVLQRKDLLL